MNADEEIFNAMTATGNIELFSALRYAELQLRTAGSDEKRAFYVGVARDLENRLAEANLGLARRQALLFGPRGDFDTAFSDALWVLRSCIRCYSPGRGCTFATYYVRSCRKFFFRRQRLRPVPFSAVGAHADAPLREPVCEVQFGLADELEHMRAAMRRVLSEREREVLRKRLWEGELFPKIGAAMGKCKGQAHNIYRRALRKLAAAMDRG